MSWRCVILPLDNSRRARTIREIYQEQSNEWHDIFDALNHVGLETIDKDETINDERYKKVLNSFDMELVNDCINIAWRNHTAFENLLARMDGQPDIY